MAEAAMATTNCVGRKRGLKILFFSGSVIKKRKVAGISFLQLIYSGRIKVKTQGTCAMSSLKNPIVTPGAVWVAAGCQLTFSRRRSEHINKCKTSHSPSCSRCWRHSGSSPGPFARGDTLGQAAAADSISFRNNYSGKREKRRRQIMIHNSYLTQLVAGAKLTKYSLLPFSTSQRAGS